MAIPGELIDSIKRIYKLQHDVNYLYVNDKIEMTHTNYLRMVRILNNAEIRLLEMAEEYEQSPSTPKPN